MQVAFALFFAMPSAHALTIPQLPRDELLARGSQYAVSGHAPFWADSDGDGELELYSNVINQAQADFFTVSDLSGQPGASPPPSFIQTSRGTFPFGSTDIDGDGTDDVLVRAFIPWRYQVGVGFGGPNGWNGTNKHISAQAFNFLVDDLDHDGIREVASVEAAGDLVVYDGVALLVEPDGGSLDPYEVLRLVPADPTQLFMPYSMPREGVDVDLDGRLDLVGAIAGAPAVIGDIESLYAQGGTQALLPVVTTLATTGNRGLVNGPAHLEVADLDGDGDPELVFMGTARPTGEPMLWVWGADTLVPGSLDPDVELSGFTLASEVTYIDWGFATLFDRNQDGAEELVLQTDTGCRPLMTAPPPAPNIAALPAWNGPRITSGGGFVLGRCAAGPDFNHDGRADVLAYGRETARPYRVMVGAL